ncbi:MAG: XdhC family protein [Oscillospiraceae bacterium]|jgi:xanthine dehydrogenase accessory factor|nr:XdhC family protein [Oscillospiraceae bacterium]
MVKLLPRITAELRSGEPVVLSIVTESQGSTPRKPGSVMATFSDGSHFGTVGGGALEYEAQRVALSMVSRDDETAAQTLGYSLSTDETGDICMICGGDVMIHFRRFEPEEANVRAFGAILAAQDGETAVWFGLRTADGADSPPEPLTKAAPGDVTLRRIAYYSDADKLITIPLGGAGRVYIFGGGHIARELVPVLTRVGFACTVYEDRGEYAKPERFPEAEVVCADFKRASEHIKFAEDDYVVIVTRGHKNDFDVLRQALPSPAGYVGCIGSRRKIAIQKQRLEEDAGLAPEAVSRLVNPIGIDIGAETPEEIAVSIAAELICVRAGGAKWK